MIKKNTGEIRKASREIMECFGYSEEFKKGYRQALLWTLGEDQCFYCGEDDIDQLTVCPKCEQIVCEECADLPCENDHKEQEPEDYLRASPQEQARELYEKW